MLNCAEFTRSVEPLKCISIYAYLLSIGKTNSSATSSYLIMEMVKQTAVQPVSTWQITPQNKNHAIKRGLGQKNCTVKNHSEFTMKNMPCVNGSIEITLEQIQHDIMKNSWCQKCCKFVYVCHDTWYAAATLTLGYSLLKVPIKLKYFLDYQGLNLYIYIYIYIYIYNVVHNHGLTPSFHMVNGYEYQYEMSILYGVYIHRIKPIYSL